jgi:hypothetical protein
MRARITLALVALLVGCSGGSGDAMSAACRSLDTGVTQLHDAGRREGRPPPQALADARSRVEGRDDEFSDAVRVVADRYITIAEEGVTGSLPSEAADALRAAVAFLERQCADGGVLADLDRPFVSE